jgi:hypothetical protein
LRGTLQEKELWAENIKHELEVKTEFGDIYFLSGGDALTAFWYLPPGGVLVKCRCIHCAVPLRASPPVVSKPSFGAKSSATSVKFTVFSGGIIGKSVGKKYKNTPLFFSTKL